MAERSASVATTIRFTRTLSLRTARADSSGDTPFPEALLNEREAGKNRGADYRFHVNVARLTLNLLPLGCVGDLLRPRVHVALTARCETHSRLVARLEVAERAHVEEKEER